MSLNHGMVHGSFMKTTHSEDDFPARTSEDSRHTLLNNSQTGMLIAHFKDDLIPWDKELKDNINSQKAIRQYHACQHNLRKHNHQET